jgi:hypothetical protein
MHWIDLLHAPSAGVSPDWLCPVMNYGMMLRETDPVTLALRSFVQFVLRCGVVFGVAAESLNLPTAVSTLPFTC